MAACGVAAVTLAWMSWHAGAIVRSGWWHGLADRSAWFYALIVPAAAVMLIAQTVEPALPRWLQRLAALPVLAWAAMLFLAVGVLARDVAGTPVGVLVLGLCVLPWLAGLTGIWPAAALWLCCAAGLLRLLVGLVLPVDTVFDALFAFAAVLAAVVVWGRLGFSRPPPSPLERIGEEARPRRGNIDR